MPARSDRDSEGIEGGGESPQEPLIGRELELDVLRRHIAGVAETRRGHVVLVLGESGVGKSRLAAEAGTEARRRELTLIPVRCLGRGAEPLLPVKEALAGYLGGTPDQIRRTLARAAPRLLDAVPFIGTFLGAIGEKLTESCSFKGVYEELSRVLVRVATGSVGLFLLVDDLHAADPDTLYFMNYLFRKLERIPVLAVVTIREEQLNDYPALADLMAEWTAIGHVTLTVVPLERAHVGEYVRKMAAIGEQADDSIVDRLFQLSGGNPFFLREALSLITQVPESRVAAEVVPPRADAILRWRLARADDITLHLLRAASVVVDTSEELAPIAYVMDAGIQDAIAALNKACELRLMREGPRGEVSFVHSLMQREVYAEMGANQRRYLHGRAGEWFERNGGMASAAFHFEQAHQFDRMVRAGYRAATQAERAGMYHTALMLYQKLRPHVSIEELGPRLAGVLIVLGDWNEAERLIKLLPVEDSRVRLLRSELQFVRGDFDAAQAEAEMALIDSCAEPIHVLIRLADIALYLGDFSEAQRYGHAALDMADTSDVVNLRARCDGIVAATEYFGGDVQGAEARFRDALELLESVSEADRDRMVHTTILANVGCIAETKQDWAGAERYHRMALRLRREVADARGVVQSLHALGRARLGAGDRDEAENYFTEAEQLAISIEETLERAKIWHTRAELVLGDGDGSRAQELATAAWEVFTNSRTRYDVTHARVTLSRAALVCGQEHQAIEHGSVARSSVLTMGYGLLNRLYPEEVYDLGERIAGALTAYACGDALGVPWENAFRSSAVPPASHVEQLPAREGCPRGVTSDDTALTLLVAGHLAERDGGCDPSAFLAELADREPMIRGLGPTTTAAIEHFRRTGEAVASGRATNGAAMRALPIGWVLPHSQADRRREVAIEMSRATHAEAAAVVAACVIAACASWALEGATPALLIRVAAQEAREAARAVGTDARLAEMLTQVSTGTWQAPAEGVSLDPYDTVTAVLSCVAPAPSLRGGLVSAVQLGGDTDTVAALVGGLLGAKLTVDQVHAELPWHQAVVLPEPDSAISEIAAALATVRAVRSG